MPENLIQLVKSKLLWAACFFCSALLLHAQNYLAYPETLFPNFTAEQFVYDKAEVISEKEEEAINRRLKNLHTAKKYGVFVMTGVSAPPEEIKATVDFAPESPWQALPVTVFIVISSADEVFIILKTPAENGEEPSHYQSRFDEIAKQTNFFPNTATRLDFALSETLGELNFHYSQVMEARKQLFAEREKQARRLKQRNRILMAGAGIVLAGLMIAAFLIIRNIQIRKMAFEPPPLFITPRLGGEACGGTFTPPNTSSQQ